LYNIHRFKTVTYTTYLDYVSVESDLSAILCESCNSRRCTRFQQTIGSATDRMWRPRYSRYCSLL